MAIPGILLAIALVSIWRAGLITVIFAIIVPDVRDLRLVRPSSDGTRGALRRGRHLGRTPTWTLMFRHILPNTVAAADRAGHLIAAAAILAEAILSFLGIGIPPEIPAGATSGRGPHAVPRVPPTSSIPASSWPSPCWPSTSWATASGTRSIRR